MEETRQDLRTPDHGDHPLQWQAGDTCLLCLMNVIQGHKGWLTVHRRYALSFFVKSLSLDPAVTLSQKQLLAHQNLVELLQRNREVSAKVVIGLLGKSTVLNHLFLKFIFFHVNQILSTRMTSLTW
jgi:hypothetical protein